MKKFIHIVMLWSVSLCASLGALELQKVNLNTIKDSVLPKVPTPAQIKFFIGNDSTQREKILATLKIDYKKMIEKEKPLEEALERQIQILRKEIDHIKSMNYRHNDFLTEQLTLLAKKYQMLPEFREVRQQISEYMKQHIEFLDNYFQSAEHINVIQSKSLYTFSDLQKLTRQIALDNEVLSRLQTKKENEESIVARMEGLLVSKEKEIKSVSENLDFLKKSLADVKTQLILLDLEKEILLLERELIVLQIEEHVRAVNFIDSQVFVQNLKMEDLQKDLVDVRRRMKVDKQDLLQCQQENNDLKKEIQASRIGLVKKRTDLLAQKVAMQEELEKLSENYKISLKNLREINDWEVADDSLIEGVTAFAVCFVQTQIIGFEQQVEAIRVEMLLQDAKLAHAQLLEDSVQSLYAITQTKFSEVDELEKKKVFYKDFKNSIQNMIKIYQDSTSELHAFIKSQHKKIQNIKKDQERFKAYRVDDSVQSKRKYNEGLAILAKALKLVEEQGDCSLKLSEKYTALIDQKEETLVLTNFMLQELDLIGVWHRSNRAVTFDGVKQIIPNLITFAQNLYGIISDFVLSLNIFSDAYTYITTSTLQFFTYSLFSVFIYILFLSLQAVLPVVYSGLMLIQPDMQGLFLLSRMAAVICGFIQGSLGPIFIWLLIFTCLSLYQFSIAFTLMFYGSSIFFLMYIARKFLVYLLDFNKSVGYALLGESFEDRFSWIFSFFSASTIFILFFRKMFMLVMLYQQSEFPVILLRLYHVVIFISVVFSIEKEELLNLIPKTNIYFQSLYDLVKDYYYLLSLFCIMVLILSDPYLGGYGHLIWFIVLNSTISALLCATMYLIHNAIKAISSWIFFREYGEFGLKERFEHAKTWYAIFVVSLFFISMGITALFIAKIWGYPLAFGQIERLFNHSTGIVISGTGVKVEYLRVIGIVRLIASVFFGFIFAFLFKRYVLQRVFDIQYVDPGVQDTIMTISRYIIIVGTIFIGFAREGLGAQAFYALVIMFFGLAWTFKDLFGDVIAYFFILVQRPIKVGDFIKIDNELVGVVKKISPRAVILRRKNSVTIVVPNSLILKSPLYNWNYTRGYIAFDDITFSVHFDVDPGKVKDLLHQVVMTHPDVLKVPAPIIRLDNFGDKGYTFMVRGYVSSSKTLNQWVIASDVRILIVAALLTQGIEVAEPVMRIRMDA